MEPALFQVAKLCDFAENITCMLVPLVLAHVCEYMWLRGPISSTGKRGGGLFSASEVRVQPHDILIAELDRRCIRVVCPDRKSIEKALLQSMQDADLFGHCNVVWSELRSLREKIALDKQQRTTFENVIRPCLSLQQKGRNNIESASDVTEVVSFLHQLAA